MHDAAFCKAASPDKSVVLHLVLRDYSLGHEVLLFNNNNALLAAADDFDKLDHGAKAFAVTQAAAICAHTWAENHAEKPWSFWWKYRRANRNADITKEVLAFREYREQGTLFPPCPDAITDKIANGEQSEGGREIGSSFMARLYNFLAILPAHEIKLYGDSVFDFPFGLGCFLYFAHLENEGAAKVLNTKEQQVKREYDEAINAIRKENAIQNKTEDTCQE